MTPSSRQQYPLPTVNLSPRQDEARPAVPVIRRHILGVSFIAARVRLVNLISGGSLIPASIDAYAYGLPRLARRAPADALSVLPLITVRIPEPAEASGLVVLPLRWHAMGTGGRPVRVLNADLMLIAAQPDRTLLRLHGAFRLPFAVTAAEPDRDQVPRRAAAASINFLLAHIRKSLTGPGPGHRSTITEA